MVLGTSLVVQWLKLHFPMEEVWVGSLVRELRSIPHVVGCGQKLNKTCFFFFFKKEMELDVALSSRGLQP